MNSELLHQQLVCSSLADSLLCFLLEQSPSSFLEVPQVLLVLLLPDLACGWSVQAFEHLAHSHSLSQWPYNITEFKIIGYFSAPHEYINGIQLHLLAQLPHEYFWLLH